MLIYFEFEEKRRKADLHWPKSNGKIVIHLMEPEMTSYFPSDLFFSRDDYGKVVFEVEDVANNRLLDLQNSLRKRLQEIVSSS